MSTNYRGYDVYELPGNAQGIATLQILNILEGFDLKSMGFQSIATFHTDDRSEESSPGPTARNTTPTRLSSSNPSKG